MLAVAIAVLAGCGGDDSSSGSGDGDATAAQEQTTPAQQQAGASYASFGEQADAQDRAAAVETVKAFLRAQAADDAAKECTLMAASTKEDLHEFTVGQSEKSFSCPELITAVSAQIRGNKIPQPEQLEITDVRVGGDRGFVIYRDADGQASAFSVVREGSAWKVGAIAAYPVS